MVGIADAFGAGESELGETRKFVGAQLALGLRVWRFCPFSFEIYSEDLPA
jgi:hypothetical protein